MANVDFSSWKLLFVIGYAALAAFCLIAAIRPRFLALGLERAAVAHHRGAQIAGTLVILAGVALVVTYIENRSYFLLAATLVAAILFAWHTPAGDGRHGCCSPRQRRPSSHRLRGGGSDRRDRAALSCVFAIVLSAVTALLFTRAERRRLPLGVAALVFGILGGALQVDLGAYSPGAALTGNFWLRIWSVYIGPAMNLRAGLVPLHDFAAQYGLGPTVATALRATFLIAGSALEVVVVALNLAYGPVLLAISLGNAVKRGWLWSTWRGDRHLRGGLPVDRRPGNGARS